MTHDLTPEEVQSLAEWVADRTMVPSPMLGHDPKDGPPCEARVRAQALWQTVRGVLIDIVTDDPLDWLWFAVACGWCPRCQGDREIHGGGGEPMCSVTCSLCGPDDTDRRIDEARDAELRAAREGGA